MRTLLGASAVALFALVGTATPAEAAPQGFNVNRFEPADRGSSWFVLDSLDLRGSPRPAFGLTLDYQHQPLAVYGPDGKVTSAIVDHVLTANVGADVVLWERLRFGVNLPVVLYTTGDQGTIGAEVFAPPADSTTVGDLRLGADLRLFGTVTSPITMALGGRLWLPTGSQASYVGDGSVRGGPRVSAAGAIGMFAYGAHLGVAFRDSKTFGNVPVDHDLLYGASAGLRLDDGKIIVGPELFGSTVLANASFKTRTSPMEILLGGHFALGAGLSAGLGIGTGLVAGVGSPGVRALGSFEWAPPVEDKKAVSARPDTDGDGIPDDEDACMDVYGQRTNDPRTNGCDDRDHDGIMDPLDACPNEAGPPDTDPKKNGCPEKKPVGDRDHDGVPDDVDACPDVVGNKSDDPDLNGCPDPDPDHDGIPTDQDACPDVPGKPDPDPTKNGCPVAFIQGGEIRIKDQVKFKTASAEILGKESDDVLNAVVEILKAHSEITKVTIEGHTDNRGAPAQNKKLSEARAASVVKWLTSHGIDKSRLTSAGFGQERPLDSNDTEPGRAMNRRVEFHIVKNESKE